MVESASEQDPAQMQPGLAAAMAQAYPELVVGIKTAHYWTAKPWDELHTPWASVDSALKRPRCAASTSWSISGRARPSAATPT
jgi:dihydroorotase